jgi:hypothetical protein
MIGSSPDEMRSGIARFGFVNRWNDAAGGPLDEPEFEQKQRAAHGWTAEKHVR